MNQQSKESQNSGFKSIFIVDPVKGERLQLAKLLKQEKFLMMTFANLVDCLKKTNPIKPDLIIYVLRRDKSEPNHLKNIKKHFKSLHFIVQLTLDVSEVNIDELKESGFKSVQKADNQDMVKELIYTLMPECQVTQAKEPSVRVN